LKLLDLFLELCLGILHLLLLGDNGSVQIGGRHGLEFLDFGLLVIVAKVNIAGTTNGLEVLVSEFLEIIVGTSPLVILKVSGVSPLEGGVSLDTIGVTKGLAIGRTVYVSDKLGGGTSEC